MDNISNYSSIGIGSAITTAILFGGVAIDDYAHSVTHIQQPAEIAEPQDFGLVYDRYSLVDTSARPTDLEQIETLHVFASTVLENTHALPKEFSQVIDENFWDLI